MSIQSWRDAPEIRLSEIHPSEIHIGDVIRTMRLTRRRCTVKMIGVPREIPGQWTFYCRDDSGRRHTCTFQEDELVRRFAMG
jgi:hypothetical protein